MKDTVRKLFVLKFHQHLMKELIKTDIPKETKDFFKLLYLSSSEEVKKLDAEVQNGRTLLAEYNIYVKGFLSDTKLEINYIVKMFSSIKIEESEKGYKYRELLWNCLICSKEIIVDVFNNCTNDARTGKFVNALILILEDESNKCDNEYKKFMLLSWITCDVIYKGIHHKTVALN